MLFPLLLSSVLLAGCAASPLQRSAPARRRSQSEAQPPPPLIRRLRGGAGELAELDAETFEWADSLPWLRYVRTHGVLQFITVLKRLQHVTGDELLWGDEIEYHIFAVNSTLSTAKLSLRAPGILADLRQKEEHLGRKDGLHIESVS